MNLIIWRAAFNLSACTGSRPFRIFATAGIGASALFGLYCLSSYRVVFPAAFDWIPLYFVIQAVWMAACLLALRRVAQCERFCRSALLHWFVGLPLAAISLALVQNSGLAVSVHVSKSFSRRDRSVQLQQEEQAQNTPDAPTGTE